MPSLFWDVTWCKLVVRCRRFGTTFQVIIFKGQPVQEHLVTGRMSPDVDNQPSTYLRNIPEEGRLDNTVAEAWDFIITQRKQNKKKNKLRLNLQWRVWPFIRLFRDKNLSYRQRDQIKEIGGACGTHGRLHTCFRWGGPLERGHLVDPGKDGRTILKCLFK